MDRTSRVRETYVCFCSATTGGGGAGSGERGAGSGERGGGVVSFDVYVCVYGECVRAQPDAFF